MRAWGLVAAVLLAIPAAQAGLTFEAPRVEGMPVVVNSGQAKAVIPVTYVCGPDEVRLAATTLVLEPPVAPTGVTVTGPQSYAIPASACQGAASQAWHGNLTFNVVASPDAQGEKPLEVVVRGAIASRGMVDGTAKPVNASTSIPVTVQFYGVMTATAPSTIGAAPPGKPIMYDVIVTNLGNAVTNVQFSLGEAAPPGWSVDVPAPVILGPSQQAGGTDFQKTVRLTVTPQEGTSNQQAFRLRIVPASTISPDLVGNTVFINVLARKGACSSYGLCQTGKASPASPLLALALVGCALVARRRVDGHHQATP
jgi:hypothetical protein